jgi:hypothetical protein
LAALKEVEDALIAIQNNAQRLQLLQSAAAVRPATQRNAGEQPLRQWPD